MATNAPQTPLITTSLPRYRFRFFFAGLSSLSVCRRQASLFLNTRTVHSLSGAVSTGAARTKTGVAAAVWPSPLACPLLLTLRPFCHNHQQHASRTATKSPASLLRHDSLPHLWNTGRIRDPGRHRLCFFVCLSVIFGWGPRRFGLATMTTEEE